MSRSATEFCIASVNGAGYSPIAITAIANPEVRALQDLNKREFFMLSLLAIAVIAMGLYPAPFTDAMQNSVADLLKHVSSAPLR